MAKRGKSARSPKKRKPSRKAPAKKKPAKPRKPTKLQGKRTARPTKAKLTRAQQREREARQKARKRRQRQRERESREASELYAAPGATTDLVDRLTEAYERMQGDHSLTLAIRRPDKRPWILAGYFRPKHEMNYRDLGGILTAWADDLTLEVMIHPQRVSFIRWEYQAKDDRGRNRGAVSGYAETGAGPWSFVIEENARSVGDGSDDDEGDADALQSKYPLTQIAGEGIAVYFAAEIENERKDFWKYGYQATQ